jgi:ribosome-associated protein
MMMDEPVSKTQKKREADVLQKTGVQLIELSHAKLDRLPLTDVLRQAINAAKTIKSHGAKRRQAQLIGKLMRAADHQAISAAFNELLEADNATNAEFHEVELWRDKLIQGGKETLTEFINAYHPDDMQQLRQLIKKAVDDQVKGKNSGASTTLFRYLRSCML